MVKKGFFPNHEENRMLHEGDVETAREAFLSNKKNRILYHLVEQRFSWMNDFIDESDKKIVELGCGAGLSKLFIHSDKLILTDVAEHEWVDDIVDAMNIKYPDKSLDVVICSHMIHHIANPATFFDLLSKKLVRGGGRLSYRIYIRVD